MNSQHEVEGYIERLFYSPGTFLEIGCWDGELISQTAWLEREKGWKGLCVDPFPRNFQNRTCKVAPVAISADGKSRWFVKVTIDRRYGGDVSYFSGFKDKIGTHWDLISEHCDYTVVPVATMTFDALMSAYEMPNHVDFLSVDTEGAELEIFQSIDFEKYSFGMIDYEHNENEEVKKVMDELLQGHGYVPLVHLRVDSIYVNGNLGGS